MFRAPTVLRRVPSGDMCYLCPECVLFVPTHILVHFDAFWCIFFGPKTWMRIHRSAGFLYILMHYYAFLAFLYPLHSSAFWCILVHPTCAHSDVGPREHMTHSDAFWCIHISCILDIGIQLHFDAFWCILQISRIPVHSSTLFSFACIRIHSRAFWTSGFRYITVHFNAFVCI